MKTVIMDTSNNYLIIGYFVDGQCLGSYEEEGHKRQSEYALVELDKILKKNDILLKDVDEMIITRGPGSYTGVRVAMTIAKTLAAVSNVKIKTVSSLAAYCGKDKAVAVIDARSKKMYVGVYNQGKAVVEDQLMEVESFTDFRKQYEDYKLVGDESLFENIKNTDLLNNIYDLRDTVDYVEDVDALVPEYIKEVEAKKLCQ